MLVLGRKVGETIVIDDQITVTVLAVKGGRIKLGVQAPKSVPVRRSEICSVNLGGVSLANTETSMEQGNGAYVCT